MENRVLGVYCIKELGIFHGQKHFTKPKSSAHIPFETSSVICIIKDYTGN